jgi:hypothetical protein
MDEGLVFVFPESQDTAVIYLEMKVEKHMTKEEFSLLSTTLESIANRINLLSNEVSNHTGIILKKDGRNYSTTPRPEEVPGCSD